MTSRARTSWLWAAALAVAVLYLLQLPSPLRLWQDGIDNLVVAESLLDGQGLPQDWGSNPPGYPAMVVALSSVGLADAPGLMFLNLVCVAAGLWAGYWLCRRVFGCGRPAAVVTVFFTALSWVVIKHATLAASDAPYFGVALLTLVALSRAEDRPTAGAWATAAALGVWAVLIRTVGMTLVPAFLWAWWTGIVRCRRGASPTTAARWMATVGVAAVVIVTVYSVAKTVYLTKTLPSAYPHGYWHGFVEGLGFRVNELGELFLNVPRSKAPAPAQGLYPVAGTMALLGLVLAVWRRWRELRAVDLYVGAYLFVLLIWPFSDARFWLPVIPLVGAGLAALLQDAVRGRRVMALARAYGAAFTVAGVAALLYSTRLSLAGPAFPRLYGDGSLQPAYQAALTDERPAEFPGKNRVALRLLRRFGPHRSQEE